jgi:hypothetical protein
MMAIRDTFLHTARWDSVGLDCAYCLHFVAPTSWPDLAHISHCGLHNVSLQVELGADGYKDGEWFCCDFRAGPDRRPSKYALEHLQRIMVTLQRDVLYGFYGSETTLKEHAFRELRPTNRNEPTP